MSAVFDWLSLVAVVAAFGVFAVASVRLAVVDLREHRLPNRELAWATSAVLLLLVIAAAAGGDTQRLTGALLAAVAYGLVMGVLWQLGRGVLGAGDVKLAPLLGLVAGWVSVWAAVLWVPLGIALVGLAVVLHAALRPKRATEFAFGPVMLAGTWLGCIVGLVAG